MENDSTWLEGKFYHEPAEIAQKKAETEERGLAFAQNFLVFEQNPLARALLEHWTQGVRMQAIAPGASVQEYAYWNSRREFIESIHAQIAFAKNGRNQPKIHEG